jgi:hypothetical protein
MPKSRGRKKPKKPVTRTAPAGIVKMTPEVHDALLKQREAFRAKFGRDPGPGDPVFFDPDADTPTQISQERMEADLDEALRKAGIDPAKAVAFKKLLR